MNMVNMLARTLAATVVGSFVAACGQPREETSSTAAAPTVPSGFTDSQFVAGISGGTAMAFAPDGRLFVTEQGGRLRVVKNGVLLETPFLTVTVDSSGERGLLGVTFDPAFASNGYVYVYYTTPTPAVHNRVSRFTASGDVAAAGSEVVLFELDNLSTATNHNGGALHFGPDGKLYVAVGDNANGSNAQSFATLFGKMLRLNTDATIPADNPFLGSTSGKYGAIWALGLRNPFTFAFQPGTGRMFINDVGATIYEEIDEGVAGGNYGWPLCEGPQCSGATSSFLAPIYYYAHGTGPTTGCAITGGTFYNPPSPTFPASYVGSYFFGDYCGNWIRRLDPGTGNAVSSFGADASAPVDLRVGPDGALYYLARGASAVGRIQYSGGGAAPLVEREPGEGGRPDEPAVPTGGVRRGDCAGVRDGLQNNLPPHEPRRTQDRARGRAALAVRLLEGLGLGPRPKRGLVAPDGVRGVKAGGVLLRPLEEMERLETGHVLEVRLALAPAPLELLAPVGGHAEMVHGDVHAADLSAART